MVFRADLPSATMQNSPLLRSNAFALAQEKLRLAELDAPAAVFASCGWPAAGTDAATDQGILVLRVSHVRFQRRAIGRAPVDFTLTLHGRISLSNGGHARN